MASSGQNKYLFSTQNHFVYTPPNQIVSSEFTVNQSGGFMPNAGKTTIKTDTGNNYNHYNTLNTNNNQPQHKPNQSTQSTQSHSTNSSNSSVKYKIVPKSKKSDKSFSKYSAKPLPMPSVTKSKPLPLPSINNNIYNKNKNGDDKYGAKLHQNMRRNSNENIPSYNYNNAIGQNPPNKSNESNESNGRSIESLFSNEYENLLNANFEIPSNGTKSQYQEIRIEINKLYDMDVGALEAFYVEQLKMLDEMLAQM